jgi:CIC family chloride channel protein
VNQESKAAAHLTGEPGNLLVLALVSLLAGAASGLVGAVFRLTLVEADRLRGLFISWAHAEGLPGFLLVGGGGAITQGALTGTGSTG